MVQGDQIPRKTKKKSAELEISVFQINGTSVENLSQTEVESLLSTSFLNLTVQKLSGTSSQTQVLQCLLEEVNEKIRQENDICREAEFTREKIRNSGSLNELQLSQQESSSAYFSGKSSPLPDDQISSTPESFSEPVLQSTSSLTPLYEEPLNGKQTDSSGDLSTEEGNSPHLGSASRSLFKLRKPLRRSCPHTHSPRLQLSVQLTHKERPMPPVRSYSYVSAITSPTHEMSNTNSQEDGMHMMPSLGPVSTNDLTSNSLSDSSPHEAGEPTVVMRKKTEPYFRNSGLRPQSAPSSRHHQAVSGSSPVLSSFECYSASHRDPLALTSSKSSTVSHPASVAVLKSTPVPCYTAKSHSVLSCEGLPAESQQCVPVQCNSRQKQSRLKGDHHITARHSRQGSSHSAEGGSEHNVHHFSGYETAPKSKHKLQRISLPNSLSLVTSCNTTTSSFCSSSVSSYSTSSGRNTPVVIPSTPIVPANEGGPALAFDFREDPLNR